MFLVRLLTSLTALSCLGFPRKREPRRHPRRARVLRQHRKIAPDAGPAATRHSSEDLTADESVSPDQLNDSIGPQFQTSSRPSRVPSSGSTTDHSHVESASSEQALNHQVEPNVASSPKTESEPSAFSCSSGKDDGMNSVHDSGIQLDSSQAESEEIRPRDVELEGREVVLEDLVVAKDGSTVTGYVRVRNEAYEKRVAVRHTQNEWFTHQDTAAKWIQSLKGGECDRFVFQLNLPQGPFSVHLAIEATQNGKTVWDNNNGNNYYIMC